MSILPKKITKRVGFGGFFKNPSFYFAFIPFVLFGLLFFGSGSLAKPDYFNPSQAGSLLSVLDAPESGDVFFGQNDSFVRETPDLKIIQDEFVYGISTPRVLSTQVLGSIMGGGQSQERKDVVDYQVQPGDTVESIAANFSISVNTLLWANDLSKNSTIKVGQSLVVLPVSGVMHIVKSGDTISEISKKTIRNS